MNNKKTLFIKEEVFKKFCKELGYQDMATIYGDFSRLVAALLEKYQNNPEKLKKIYQTRYKPSANIRAILRTYKKWVI